MNSSAPLFRRLLFSTAVVLCFAIGGSAMAANDAATQSNGFLGASYGNNATSHDFRNITTLNDFNRMVYRERWQGIRAADAIVEMRKFNGIHGSPALRAIWRDLLLSDYSAMKVGNGNEQSALMAERIRLLNRLGFFDEAVHLYEQAAMKKPIPEAVAHEGIEALAQSGSADGACLEVFMAAKQLAGDNWQRDAAICSAYFGDHGQAKVLYNNVSSKSDGGFRTVFKMLNGDQGKSIQPNIPPLWRTLLLAKGATISSKALSSADAMTLSAIATNRHVPLGTRLAAASRAAEAGTIGIDKLRKLYEMKRSSGDGVSADSSSQSDLYAAARFTFEGNARAGIVRKAIQNLNPPTQIKGQVFTWIVDKLTLQVERIRWFAPYGYALMTATNRTDSANMYYEAGNLHNSPYSIVHALVAGKPWSPADQQNWQAAMTDAGLSKYTKKLYKVARSYDQENKLAMNEHAAIKTDESKPVGLLSDSVRKGGRGLTLLVALNRLGEVRQLSDVPEAEIVEIITGLTKQGLFGERKKIALEMFLQTML